MAVRSFDDVVLLPQLSDINSRHNVDISTQLGAISLDIPIISSPMDTVTEGNMAREMYCSGGRGILHRYMSPTEQARYIFNSYGPMGAAVGVKPDSQERVQKCIEAGAEFICIDVAHGHHTSVYEMIKWIKANYGDVHVMAGNVATATGYSYLCDAGADSVRVGIGGGSMCTTRVQTGHGLPTLESLMRVQKSSRWNNVPYIADGGIRTPGDIVKALSAGASAVILGRLLAGADESAAPIIDGEHKLYRGMASSEAQEDWRGYVSVEEGTNGKVKRTGLLKTTVEDISASIRSGLSYSGARNIYELQEKAVFQDITHNGYIEGTPHGT